MPFIPLQSLLFPTTTPAQQIALNQFYTTFNSGAAVNRSIANVEPLYYDGAIAGTEFLTYAATKMYFALEVKYGILAANIDNAATAYVTVYDESNTISMSLTNLWGYFNVAPKYVINSIFTQNDDFSRVAVTGYTYISFIGYRFTLK
jgi:hypothetical protein